MSELSEEELEAVKKMRAEKAAKSWSPPRSEDIPDAVKVEGFDRVYECLLEMWNYRRDNGNSMKDEEHWVYESCMELFTMLMLDDPDGPKDIWEVLRAQ